MGIENVGGLVIYKILSKLGPREAARVGCVSHRFREWAFDEFLWYQFCVEELHLSSPEDPLGNSTPSFKAAYQAWRKSFGMYPWSLVLRVKRCWERIKRWLVLNFPETVTTLLKGATEDEINNLENSLEVKLPLPTRLIYRFCAGQHLVEYSESLIESLLGLIGGYSFCGHLVNGYLLPLIEVISMTNDIRRNLFENIGLVFGTEYLAVAASSDSAEGEKFFFLNCSNGELSVGTWNFLETGEMISCVPDDLIRSVHDVRDCQQQDGLLLWLEEHGRRLESGLVKVREEIDLKYICLFPEESSLCSSMVTNGVQVRASALFIPEFSETILGSNDYRFSYSIRMSLKPEGCIVNGTRLDSCQLCRAHWVVRENDKIVSKITEENVVGKNPVLHRGEKEFVYQGCIPIRTPQGSIKGSYTFVSGRLTDPKGTEFEVEVPQIFLEYPEYVF